MDINELTIGQAKELSELFAAKGECIANPFEVGTKYLIRTVTHIQTGLCSNRCGVFVFLTDAAWIADTGRFADCLEKGNFSEVEPYPSGVWVNTTAIIDFSEFGHELPRSQK